MNCLPNISIALSLLALTAGVWFLYKTQKENLGILYKIAAWFVIIVTVLNMASCCFRCCMNGCMEERECGRERMYDGECGMGRMHGRGMWHSKRMMMHDGMNCCNMEMMRGGCRGENEECEEGSGCEGMEEGKCGDREKEGECKMIIKKDSVIKKK